jgi:hypothetical protein
VPAHFCQNKLLNPPPVCIGAELSIGIAPDSSKLFVGIPSIGLEDAGEPHAAATALTFPSGCPSTTAVQPGETCATRRLDMTTPAIANPAPKAW